MRQAVPMTRYAGCTRARSVLILAGLAFAIAWCLSVALTREVLHAAKAGGPSDGQLYGSVVERVRAGEGYYEAAGRELRAQGYPTRSPFNWRLPTYAWLIGRLPSTVGARWVLVAASLAVVVMAAELVLSEVGMAMAVVTGVLVAGATAVLASFSQYVYYPELWSGVLIALSVCAYAYESRPAGVGAGLLALAFRELALPYVVVALGLALRRGRRGEAAAWAVGLAGFGLVLLGHAAEVAGRATAADTAHAAGWVRFGGAEFLLATTRANFFLMRSPTWCAAVYLPVALLGAAGWRGPAGTLVGLSAWGYAAAFGVVGQPFNFYWGLESAPLLALGVAWAPASLRDLARTALGGREGRTDGRLSIGRGPDGRPA